MKLRSVILSLYLTHLLGGTFITPLLPGFANYLGDENLHDTNLFMTMSFLVCTPVIILSGFINTFINKKKLIIFALILYIIALVGFLIATNIQMFLFFRALTGIASGFIIPYSSTLITENFDRYSRKKIYFQGGLLLYFSAIAILLVTGGLSFIYWRLGFLSLLIALIPLYLVKKHMHNPVVYKLRNMKDIIIQFKIKRKVYIISVIYLIITIITFNYFTKMPFLITNLYNEPSSFKIAISTSIYMLGAMLANITLALLVNKYHLKTIIMNQIFFIFLGSITLTFFYNNIFIIYLGSFFIGIGYGAIGSLLTIYLSLYTHRKNRNNSFAVFTSTIFIGQSISPFFYSSIIGQVNLTGNYSLEFLLQSIILLLLYITAYKFPYIIEKRR